MLFLMDLYIPHHAALHKGEGGGDLQESEGMVLLNIYVYCMRGYEKLLGNSLCVLGLGWSGWVQQQRGNAAAACAFTGYSPQTRYVWCGTAVCLGELVG